MLLPKQMACIQTYSKLTPNGSTLAYKRSEGAYEATTGKFSQQAFTAAMRCLRKCAQPSIVVTFVVWMGVWCGVVYVSIYVQADC